MLSIHHREYEGGFSPSSRLGDDFRIVWVGFSPRFGDGFAGCMREGGGEKSRRPKLCEWNEYDVCINVVRPRLEVMKN